MTRKSPFSPSAFFLAIFRQMDPNSRSRFRSPASMVYSVMICKSAWELMETMLDFNPFSLICLGSKYFSEIAFFSSSVYPDRVITSMRSSNGEGMVSVMLAVRINITLDRSKGRFK